MGTGGYTKKAQPENDRIPIDGILPSEWDPDNDIREGLGFKAPDEGSPNDGENKGTFKMPEFANGKDMRNGR